MINPYTFPLNYASPGVSHLGRPLFRTLLVLFALTGGVMNLAFIGLSVEQLHKTLWIYHDLKQNSRALGREISPAMIAALSDRSGVCLAFGTVGISCSFGLLLASNLLIATLLLKTQHDAAIARLAQYRRWKPLGAVMTAVTLFWASSADLNYWVAASRHMPVGARPPFVETILLIIFALLPWWWIGESVCGAPSA